MFRKINGPSGSITGWAVFISRKLNRMRYVANRSRVNIGKRRLRVRGASRGGAGVFSGALAAGDSSGAPCCPRTGKAEQSFRGNLSGRSKSGHAAERSFTAEGHAIGDTKLCQQGRNVELHRAFRNVEFCGDFLIREALKDAVQHFLFAAAYFYSRSKCASRGQKFLSALRRGVQERLPGNNHQFVIFGRLASHEAMDGEQACDFFDRHAAIGIRLDAETHRARGTFAQNKTLWKKWLNVDFALQRTAFVCVSVLASQFSVQAGEKDQFLVFIN